MDYKIETLDSASSRLSSEIKSFRIWSKKNRISKWLWTSWWRRFPHITILFCIIFSFFLFFLSIFLFFGFFKCNAYISMMILWRKKKKLFLFFYANEKWDHYHHNDNKNKIKNIHLFFVIKWRTKKSIN